MPRRAKRAGFRCLGKAQGYRLHIRSTKEQDTVGSMRFPSSAEARAGALAHDSQLCGPHEFILQAWVPKEVWSSVLSLEPLNHAKSQPGTPSRPGGLSQEQDT